MEARVSETLEILLFASMVGALDVGYFHLYKFRLYAQPGSVLEELTHLARHLLFIGAVLTLMLGRDVAVMRTTFAVIVALDLANTVADVLLEADSRAPLGGLPRLEYLVHVISSLALGAAFATFYFRGTEVAPLDRGLLVRGYGTVVIGVVLFVVEAGLFAHAIARRRGVRT